MISKIVDISTWILIASNDDCRARAKQVDFNYDTRQPILAALYDWPNRYLVIGGL